MRPFGRSHDRTPIAISPDKRTDRGTELSAVVMSDMRGFQAWPMYAGLTAYTKNTQLGYESESMKEKMKTQA